MNIGFDVQHYINPRHSWIGNSTLSIGVCECDRFILSVAVWWTDDLCMNGWMFLCELDGPVLAYRRLNLWSAASGEVYQAGSDTCTRTRWGWTCGRRKTCQRGGEGVRWACRHAGGSQPVKRSSAPTAGVGNARRSGSRSWCCTACTSCGRIPPSVGCGSTERWGKKTGGGGKYLLICWDWGLHQKQQGTKKQLQSCKKWMCSS